MPKLGYVGGGRAAPIDRGGAGKNQVYSAAAVAPHAETTRWTYTVPAAKSAVVQSAVASAVRATAAAPVGYVFASVKHNDGTVNTPIVIAAEFGNAVDSDARMNAAGAIYLVSGAVLTGTTADGSTGGTVNYEVGASVLEFTQ